MDGKVEWILKFDFGDKKLWAPYHIKNDLDYFDDLRQKYNILYMDAQKAGADATSLKIIKDCSTKIEEAITKYYHGQISSSHQIIKDLIDEVKNNSLAVDKVHASNAFPGENSEIQFFRARTSEKNTVFLAKDMLHIPLSKRGKTGNYRFSIPGIPSLYLGNTTYVCWIESGCPAEHDFYVSPVLMDGEQKLLNLAVMTGDCQRFRDIDADYVHCWLKLIILMIATSYVVEEEDRIFKSEYIVSQSIMLACKECGLDGVAYYSKRVADEMFAYAAINVALFTDYQKGEDYSSICGHIKIDDAFNYALYKQLGLIDRIAPYDDLRVLRSGLITNIGNFERQFKYADTEFCAFDQFLFATWKNKDTISFGNALKST